MFLALAAVLGLSVFAILFMAIFANLSFALIIFPLFAFMIFALKKSKKYATQFEVLLRGKESDDLKDEEFFVGGIEEMKKSIQSIEHKINALKFDLSNIENILNYT